MLCECLHSSVITRFLLYWKVTADWSLSFFSLLSVRPCILCKWQEGSLSQKRVLEMICPQVHKILVNGFVLGTKERCWMMEFCSVTSKALYENKQESRTPLEKEFILIVCISKCLKSHTNLRKSPRRKSKCNQYFDNAILITLKLTTLNLIDYVLKASLKTKFFYYIYKNICKLNIKIKETS